MAREVTRVLATFSAPADNTGAEGTFRLVGRSDGTTRGWSIERQSRDALGQPAWVEYVPGISASAAAHERATLSRAFLAALLGAVTG